MNEQAQTNKPISIEHLMDFLDGLLDPETARSLANRIEQNDEWASVFEGIKFFYEEKGKDREVLERYLISLANRYPQWLTAEKANQPQAEEDPSKPRRFLFYKIAAAIALILVPAILVIQFFNASPSADQLVAEEINDTYNPPVLVRSNDKDAEQSWTQVIETYKNSDFKSASILFEEIVQNQPRNYYASFYAGLCYLYTNQPGKAKNYLSLVSNSNSRMREQAMWYLALSLYLNDEIETSKEVLQKIIRENEYKYDRAEVLLNAINEKL